MLQPKKIAGVLGAMALSISSLSASSEKPNGCMGPVLCPSFPVATKCGDCCYTWHVSVGALYQQPGFADMIPGFAYNPVFQDPTAGSWAGWVNRKEETLEAQYDYSGGIAVELGHLFKHDAWFFGATFDWIHGDISSKAYSDRNTLYRPSSDFDYGIASFSKFNWTQGTFGRVIYSANTNIYNLGVKLSRGAYLSNRFSIEPFGGIHALWFDNNQTKKYQQPSSDAEFNSKVFLTNNQQNWGVGPEVGLNIKYTITEGLSLYSDNHLGALYGGVNKKVITTITAGTNNEGGEDPRIAENYVSNTQVMYIPVRNTIGVELSRYFNEQSQFAALRIGYDAQCVVSPSNKSVFQLYWDVGGTGQTSAVYNSVNNGYYLSGLKVDVIIDF